MGKKKLDFEYEGMDSVETPFLKSLPYITESKAKDGVKIYLQDVLVLKKA